MLYRCESGSIQLFSPLLRCSVSLSAGVLVSLTFATQIHRLEEQASFLDWFGGSFYSSVSINNKSRKCAVFVVVSSMCFSSI